MVCCLCHFGSFSPHSSGICVKCSGRRCHLYLQYKTEGERKCSGSVHSCYWQTPHTIISSTFYWYKALPTYITEQFLSLITLTLKMGAANYSKHPKHRLLPHDTKTPNETQNLLSLCQQYNICSWLGSSTGI